MSERVVTSFQFERPKGSSKWTRVRVCYRQHGANHEDLFELGEPVRCVSVTILSLPSYPQGETAIWWIQSFMCDDEDGWVLIAGDREGSKPSLRVLPRDLEKLVAMERLAVEYANP